MTKLTKRQLKANERRIEEAYRQKCSGIEINIMDIGKVFEEGERVIAEGANDEILGEKLLAFTQSIAI